MTNSRLDVIVLGVLSALTIAIVGAYALIHPGRTIPPELVGLAGVVSGGLVGRAMPALTGTTPSSSSSTPPAGNELTGVVTALTDTLGAVLANPDTSSDQTTSAAPAPAAVAPAVPVRPVVPTPAPAVAPNTVQAQ